MPILHIGHMEQRRTQEERSKAAREQIAQAALGVFALKGYGAASMDDICLAAGCSKGGLYHHFRTKAAVLSEVVDRLALSGALMAPHPAEATLSLPPQAFGRVLLEVWAEASRDQALRLQLKERYQAYLDASMRTAIDLAEILRIGALIQLLTRHDEIDAAEAARRLGLERAA